MSTILPLVVIVFFVAAALTYYLLSIRGRSRVAPPLMALFRSTGASEGVAGYLAREQSLKAMQAYQSENTVSLRDAQAAIEQMRLNASRPDTMLAAGIPASVVMQMERGETIAAIKAYWMEKNVPLREAKTTIDQLMDLKRYSTAMNKRQARH